MKALRRLQRRLRRKQRQTGRVDAKQEDLNAELQHYRRNADRASDRGKAAERKAAQWRRKDRPWLQAWWEARAARSHARAHNRSMRAQNVIADLRRIAQRENRLEKVERTLEKAIAKWKREHGPRIEGNKVLGGTPRERLVLAALKSAAISDGGRTSHYSQAGAYDVTHALGVVPWGNRSDCSSWFASVYWACGLEDPNGLGFRAGFTGTLLQGGRRISREQLKPGDAVIYGFGNGFHIEMYVGPGTKTIGHGSDPIDAGTIDMISGTKTYISYL